VRSIKVMGHRLLTRTGFIPSFALWGHSVEPNFQAPVEGCLTTQGAIKPFETAAPLPQDTDAQVRQAAAMALGQMVPVGEVDVVIPLKPVRCSHCQHPLLGEEPTPQVVEI
jgi:hypothetical protein